MKTYFLFFLILLFQELECQDEWLDFIKYPLTKSFTNNAYYQVFVDNGYHVDTVLNLKPYDASEDQLCLEPSLDNLSCNNCNNQGQLMFIDQGQQKCFITENQDEKFDINNQGGMYFELNSANQQVENIQVINPLCKATAAETISFRNLQGFGDQVNDDQINFQTLNQGEHGCFFGCQSVKIAESQDDKVELFLYTDKTNNINYCVQDCELDGIGLYPYEFSFSKSFERYKVNLCAKITDMQDKVITQQDFDNNDYQYIIKSYCNTNCNKCIQTFGPIPSSYSGSETNPIRYHIFQCQEVSYINSMYGTDTNDPLLSFKKARALSYEDGSHLDSENSSARIDSILNVTYYLTSEDKSCYLIPSGCNGDSDKPFDDISLILKNLHEVKKIGNYLEVVVTILLVKGGDNIHYFLDRFDDNFSVVINDKEESYFMDPYIYKVFDRVSTVFTMKTYTSADGCTQNCYNSSEKAFIKWKSHLLNFMVTKESNLQNIIFDGADMFNVSKQDGNLFSLHIKSKFEGCVCDSNYDCNYNIGDESQIICSGKDSDVLENLVADELNLENFEYKVEESNIPEEFLNDSYKSDNFYYWFRKPQGVFALQYLKDYTNASIPTLNLINCEFQNFNYHQYSKTLISLDPVVSKLNIQNSKFSNCYFHFGLITNSLNLGDRDQPWHKMQRIYTYEGSDTQSIVIQDSVFQKLGYNYNFKKYYQNIIKDKSVINEGVVLFITGYDGNIEIKNNTFDKNLMRQILDDQFLEEDKTCKFAKDLSEEVVKYNTLLFDLGIQKSLIEPKKGYDKDSTIDQGEFSTSTLINIRFLKQGFNFYDNTITSNLMGTGVGFFINGFENTKDHPIFVNNNIFKNNFALHYGVSFVIFQGAMDYTKLNMNGIFIGNNQFKQGMGCQTTFGNVIINGNPQSNFNRDFNSGQDLDENNEDEEYELYRQRESAFIFQFVKIFQDYLQNINTEFSNAVTKTINSITFDVNRVIFKNNVFEENYISFDNGIHISSSPNIELSNNSFTKNGYISNDFSQLVSTVYNSNAFTTITGKSLQLTYSENFYISTPIAVIFGNNIQVSGNTFDNNGCQNVNLDYVKDLADSIYIDQLLGAGEINLNQNIIKNNAGSACNEVSDNKGRHLIQLGYFKEYYDDDFYTNDQGVSFFDGFEYPQLINGQYDNTQTEAIQTYGFLRTLTSTVNMNDNTFINNIGGNLQQLTNGYTGGLGYIFKIVHQYKSETDYIGQPNKNSIALYSNFNFKNNNIQTTKSLIPVDMVQCFYVFENIEISGNTISESGCLEKTGNTSYTQGWFNFQSSYYFNSDQLIQNNYVQKFVLLIDSNTFSNSYGGIININYKTGYKQSNYIVLPGQITIQNLTINSHTCNNCMQFQTPKHIIVQDITVNQAEIDETLILIGDFDNNVIDNENQTFQRIYLNDITTQANIVKIQNVNKFQDDGSTLNNFQFNNVYIDRSIGDFIDEISENYEKQQINLCFNIINAIMNIDDSECKNNSFQYSESLQTVSGLIATACASISQTSEIWTNRLICDSTTMTDNQIQLFKQESSPIQKQYIINLQDKSKIHMVECQIKNHQLTTGGINGVWTWIWSKQSTFYGNSSLDIQGASVFSITSTSTLDILADNIFEQNQCDNCDSIISSKDNSKITIVENNNFLNNKAGNNGCISITTGVISITGSTFNYNESVLGASILTGKLCELNILKNIISHNKSKKNSLYLGESTADIQENTFEDNLSEVRSANIYVSEGINTDIKYNIFKGLSEQTVPNSIKIKGYFINLFFSQANIQYNTFESGIAYDGGSIYSSNSNVDSQYVHIKNNIFTDNYALRYGGALDISSYTILQNNTFTNSTALQAGSGIYVQNGLVLDIQNCTFQTLFGQTITLSTSSLLLNGKDLILQGNQESLTYGIICNSCLELQLDNTILQDFNGNYAQKGAALVIKQDQIETNQFIEIKNSQFQNNKAVTGSAIYILINDKQPDNLSVINIQTTIFQNNTAVQVENIQSSNENQYGYGGAILFDCLEIQSKLNLKNGNTFINNTAYAGGALYFSNYPIIYETEQTYDNNTAMYGQDIGSYGIKLKLEKNADESIWLDFVKQQNETLFGSRRILENMEMQASGQVIYPPLVISIQDEFQNILNIDSYSTLQVSSDDDVTFGNRTIFTASQGYYIMYPFSVLKKPNNTAKFKFTSSAIKILDNRNDVTYESNISIDTSLRNCVIGEKLTQNYACVECPETFYSLFDYQVSDIDYNDLPQCITCPEGGVCPGKDKLGPDQNYWRYDQTSHKIIKCYNKEACLGSTIEQNDIENKFCNTTYHSDPNFCVTGYCQTGYEGILCASCQEGYARDNPLFRTCVSCIANDTYYIRAVIIMIIGLVVIVLMINNALKISDKKKQQELQVQQKILQLKQQKKKSVNKVYIAQKTIDDKNKQLQEQEEQKMNDSQNNQQYQNQLDHRKNSFNTPNINSFKNINDDLIRLSDDSDDSQIDEVKEEKEKQLQQQQEYLESEDISPVLTKILFNYIQIVSVIGSFEFNWPDTVTSLQQSNAEFLAASQALFSLDCLMKMKIFTDLGMRLFFIKLMFYAVSPIFFILMSFIVWKIIFCLKQKYKNMEKQEKKEQFNSFFITTIIIILFAIHPKIIEQSFQAFSCINVSDDEHPIIVLEQDLEIICWEPYHYYYAFTIALPSLIFWGTGIPLLAMIILIKNKKDLDKMSLRARYGFLYEGFKGKFYFWESIVFYRKVIIILISVFLTQYSVSIQATLVLGVGTVNYLYQRKYNPYYLDVLNEMEQRSLWCSTITLYCALYFLTGQFEGWVANYILFSVILFFTLYFLIFWFRQFVVEKSARLNRIETVSKYFGPCLKVIVGNGRFKYPQKEGPQIKTFKDDNGQLIQVQRDPLDINKFLHVQNIDDAPQKTDENGNENEKI